MKNILDVCSALTLGTEQPVQVDFIGKGNLWINNVYDPSVLSLAQYAIYQAIIQTAPGQLSIIGYDSDLSGVFAPFSELSAGESKLLEMIPDEQSLKQHLVYLRQHIQAVQNVIQGRERDLISFRRTTGHPVESYKLIVLSLDMGLLDNSLRAELALLMRAGPSCGISFLIISTTIMSIQTQSGRELNLSVQALAPNISVLEPNGASVKLEGENQWIPFRPLTADSIIRNCVGFIDAFKHAKLPTVLFSELHDMNQFWNCSSTDGLTFAVGQYGINQVEITIGDEINQRHNVLITGAVGQGKSNLISVIIHSLCQRYSPRELKLYLLDFKEGVTFKPFSNIGQDEYLPHAKALGLESDVSFGIAVLDTLFLEYQRRMRLLKEKNLKSIREYRQHFPAEEMPRIVVIIDEFQMMFGEDIAEGQSIAEQLEKSVRLFRAAGIHFILASQTLCGTMALAQKKDSIFSQVPIRIALKNSLNESMQTLSINNPAAAFLRPREAIINLDYGEVSQNKKTVVAFADEKILIPLRKKWWEMARSYCPAPYVFEGDKRITVAKSTDILSNLRSSNQNAALLGEKISVDGQSVMIHLPAEPGRNIAILGAPDRECNNAIGIIQGIALSLAIQHPQGDARFIFFDFTKEGASFEQNYPNFSTLMENSGYYIECYGTDQFTAILTELNEAPMGNEDVYIFGVGMDKWNFTADPFGTGSPLKTFVENTPAKRMHFIGWWVKASGFSSQVSSFGSSDAFNTKVFLRIDERTVQSLTSPFIKWKAQDNRALIIDEVEFSDAISFIPYSPVGQNDITAYKTMIWN